MSKDKLNLIKIAKSVNQEIFVEELLRANTENLLKKYNKSKNLLKAKILITKIFYSVFFGILPAIPLMTYFEMINGVITQGYSIEIAVLGGSLLFLFFFILQFFNVFLMGMIEAGLIMSNSLFSWLKTLPISSNELQKLKIISVFRTFDLPLIVITLGFPMAMFIGTLNFIIFLICLGISMLQSTTTFIILTIFGERINRIIDINDANSRKTTILRLINIFSFVIIFFGSLIFVQWAITSMNSFFTSPLVQESSAILNLILATIPFLSSSYLIVFLTIPIQFNFHFWIGVLCGLGLFIIFTYWIFTKAISGLKKITLSDDEIQKKNKNSHLTQEHLQINIKMRKPTYAHFIKDLSITFRNLKIFLSAITPIIISFVFTFTLNFTVLKEQTPLDTEFIYTWSVILAFQPIICGMLLYNLMNLEESGDPIFSSLPIIPKNQAKSKLLYFIIIQTISVISPYLVYMFEPNFIALLLTVLVSLPFAWFILISMFEIRICFFGRAKYRFVLEPVNSEYKMSKWARIYILEYILTIVIISMGTILNEWGILHFISIYTLVLLCCYFILLISFKIIFALTRKPKNKKFLKLSFDREVYQIIPDDTQRIIFSPTRKPNKKKSPELSLDKEENQIKSKNRFFIMYPWSSIILLLILNFFFVSLGNLYLNILSNCISNVYNLGQINQFQIILWYIIFPTLFLYFIKINFIPNFKGTTYDTSDIRNNKLEICMLGIFGILFILLFHYSYTFVFPTITSFYENIPPDVYKIFVSFVFALWNEILFRGIIFPVLLTKYNRSLSLVLNSGIFFLYYFIYFITLSIVLNTVSSILIIAFFYICIVNFFLTYLFSKKNNIYPAVFTHFISTLFGAIPLYYFGYYYFFYIIGIRI